ncbi:RDD family protein [Candidatus Methylacidithermus pantelleriae]|uniref:RDD domain-containing protein n=1 Tax=Candidatus Methylacidithermus pantelleriae TaxID=2744239 RepID=A0A8J2FMH7_9BACT|nr:hypothetical protein MPNT_10015 [Candidatus Methylacidithermus pantelleriae]
MWPDEEKWAREGLAVLLSSSVCWPYELFFVGLKGQTLGKMLMKIKVLV